MIIEQPAPQDLPGADDANRPPLLMRVTTALVAGIYLCVTVTPPAQAAESIGRAVLAQVQSPPSQLLPAPQVGPRAEAAQPVSPGQLIKAELQQLERAGVKDRTLVDARRQTLEVLGQALAKEHQEVLLDFDRVGTQLRERKLPEEILERHQQVSASYRSQAGRLERELADIQKIQELDALKKQSRRLREDLERHRDSRSPQPMPRQLPFGASKQQMKEPRATSREFADLVVPSPVPGLQLAAIQPQLLFMAAQVPAPGAEYLASSEDAQITPEITALATQLERNPIRIYEWVRNHIDYIPSYGSVQGSARVLKTKQGNAYDTASLLIALLRSSGIPARYVFGTVEVPIERVMNWVGGVQSPQAALDLLSQGGVPVRGLAQGGVIRMARMEHVWVEAFVDFNPSRGARNIQPDSWIAMDASFKQYEFTAGMDVRARPLPSELQSLAELAQQVQIDAGTGRLSGLTPPRAQTFMTEAKSKMLTYFSEAEAAAQVPLREGRIIELTAPVLAASLPYKVIATSLPSAEVPAAAKRKFRFDLFTSPQSQAGGSSVIAFESNLPALTGRRLTLQFTPSTDADRAALNSYFPSAGGQPAQIPGSIPGYLIHLTARLLLDDVEVQRATGFVLGQEIAMDLAIQKHTGDWHAATNVGTAGEFMAISIDHQGVGSDRLAWGQSQTPQAMLHEAAEAYWAHASEQLKVLAGLGIALAYRQPSFGAFATRLDTVYSYGIPRLVRFAGTEVDIDALLTSAVAFDGSEAGRISAVNQIGAFGSSLENEIPQVYLGSSPTTRGASAISAIAAAVAQGQALYEITEENVAAALPSVQQSADVEADIQAAVLAGYRVRVSQSPVQIGSWTGAGYVIEDLQTGSAAYRISGGANGGSTPDPLGDAVAAVGLGVLNIVIPPAMAKASQQSCDSNNEDQQFKVNWQLILFMALFTAMLLAAAGSGGSLAPPVVAALRVLIPAFLAVTSAQASTGGSCAIFYPGATGGLGPMIEATQHWAAAQGSGSPKVLTYMGTDVIEELVDRSWYNFVPECSPAARAAYSAANGGAIGACDEYPFAGVYEGGALNYGLPNNYVSLRLINFGQNSRAGSVWRWFMLRCGVSKNQKFEVRPTAGATTGTNSEGLTCYP